MNGVYQKMESDKFYCLEEIVSALKKEIDADVLCEEYRHLNDSRICIISFEKFFWRSTSYAGLTVVITEFNDKKTADIIGTGGSSSIMEFSWGANTWLPEVAENVLKRYGFYKERV